MDPSEMLTNSVFGNLMVEVAESIAYDLNNEFVVLVRNEGIIPNFESRAIIEVAGTIGKDGAKGMDRRRDHGTDQKMFCVRESGIEPAPLVLLLGLHGCSSAF